jgi:hypothetical protein
MRLVKKRRVKKDLLTAFRHYMCTLNLVFITILVPSLSSSGGGSTCRFCTNSLPRSTIAPGVQICARNFDPNTLRASGGRGRMDEARATFKAGLRLGPVLALGGWPVSCWRSVFSVCDPLYSILPLNVTSGPDFLARALSLPGEQIRGRGGRLPPAGLLAARGPRAARLAPRGVFKAVLTPPPSTAALCISFVILNTEYTGCRQDDVNVRA